MFGKMLEMVRASCPLIHNITNYVTVNDCANILLACGASPIMADDREEVAEITSICGGLNLNIGTLNSRTIASMLIAGRHANDLGHPVVLDPVGVGASKLRTETALRLSEQLPGMGLTNAFTAAADFSRMADAAQHIDEVIHKTYLSIDEEGTEAAAATAVIMTKSARPVMGLTVTLDRPYLMAIVDNETKCLLFLGVINTIPD